MGMNSAVIMGRMTADPELKQTPNGVAVTKFCVAVDRKYQAQGQEKKVDWIDAVAWRNTAEFICKYFQKGSMIAFRGEIQTRTYQDEGGKNRKVTEIMVEEASFCGAKNESGSTGNQSGYESPAYSNGTDNNFEEVTGDDGLPF